MPQTPDRTPGVSDEEGTLYESTALSTVPGEQRYDGTRFSLYDAVGEFDPRETFRSKVSSNDTTPKYLLEKLVQGTGIILTELGDGGDETLEIKTDAGDVAAQLFGACEEDDTVSSTSSSIFQEKLKMTTPSLDAGDWIILYHAILSVSTGNGRLEIQCQVDDTTIIAGINTDAGGSGKEATFAGHKCLTLTAGVHEIDIDYRKAGGGGDVNISQARLAIWRIG